MSKIPLKRKLRLATKIIWVFNITLIIIFCIAFIGLKIKETYPVSQEILEGKAEVVNCYKLEEAANENQRYITDLYFDGMNITVIGEKTYYECLNKKKVHVRVSKDTYIKFSGKEINYSIISVK